MNRGSNLQPLQWPSCSPCFNEAPIHESGKSRTTARRRSPSGGFNEAPIHESGKCAHYAGLCNVRDLLQ